MHCYFVLNCTKFEIAVFVGVYLKHKFILLEISEAISNFFHIKSSLKHLSKLHFP